VTNPIDAAGTDEETWRGWPELGRLPAVDLTGWGRVLVVSAHPDDEVLGVGGTLSLLAGAGARIRLVAVTDGEASQPGLAGLARRRIEETAAALDRLGVAGATEVVRLGMPDTGVAAMTGPLASRLGSLGHGFDVCLAPWSGDLHADHEAVGRAAVAAGLHPVFFPIWAWHWALPGDPRLPWGRAVRVALPAETLARKRAAIECFVSQLEPRGESAPVLPPEILAHFTRDQEVLFN
jgi:LmbE family N-acetylglucosaminyl deacetylase